MSLAYCIWHMADSYESYHLYEKFLELIKDIINKSHIFDLHGSLIMALLSMGRDDEAFALLKVGNDLDMFGKILNWKVLNFKFESIMQIFDRISYIFCNPYLYFLV